MLGMMGDATVDEVEDTVERAGVVDRVAEKLESEAPGGAKSEAT